MNLTTDNVNVIGKRGYSCEGVPGCHLMLMSLYSKGGKVFMVICRVAALKDLSHFGMKAK
jgi:hypothetical protein